MSGLNEQQLAEVNAGIGDVQPATDALLVSFAQSIGNRRDHKHDREDWYCLNLSSYMGERAAPVLRRLLDAEVEVEQLRVARDQFADRVDTLTSVAKGNKRHVTALMGDLSAAQSRIAELEQQLAQAGEHGAQAFQRAALNGEESIRLSARVTELEQQLAKQLAAEAARAPGLCPPCKRGDCDECMAVDHPDLPGLYTCHYVDQPHKACRRGGERP